MRIAYVFGGRYDAVALGGNAVDIREDLAAMETLGHDVAFRAFEEAPIELPAAARRAKSRLPAPAWATSRDIALMRKNHAWRNRLLEDVELSGRELVFEYWSPESFGGAALARQLGAPHILENLDPLTDQLRGDSRSPFARRFRAHERRRRQMAAALIVMSQGMGDYLVDEWGVARHRVHWLPQGVNIQLFAPPEPSVREATRLRLDPSGRKLVGFVGSLATYQRVDVLVEAMRLLQETRDDIRLVLVGGSPERARAVGAGDDAMVLSHVPYEDVPAIVGSLDVAVLPDSNWYGSPVKVLEYGAAGVPVVAPDIGPVRDLLEAPDEGILVAAGDAIALAAGIACALDDPALARTRANRFREKILVRFDRLARTRQLLDLCARLVEENARA